VSPAHPLDTALRELAAHGPDLTNGFTSHAPMVAEALVALGRADAVLPWLEQQRPLLTPRPAAAAPIAPAAWRDALGREERTADWMQLFRGELEAAPWRDVAARWTARLAPGFCGAANHGLLRVAHAVRALSQRESAERRAELGDALGLWAASYQTLPTPERRGEGRLAPLEALAAVPLQPAAERVYRGSIVSALAGLSGFAAFAPVIDWIDVSEAPDAAISALTGAFARGFLANARDPLTHIVFVHAVTGAAALRSLVPLLDAAPARALIRYGWQAGAALQAALGSAPPVRGPLAPPARGREALVDAAVASGDDHGIKLTEACLREYAVRPDPVYLCAADHALTALAGGRR
jgi:hypothetical protein